MIFLLFAVTVRPCLPLSQRPPPTSILVTAGKSNTWVLITCREHVVLKHVPYVGITRPRGCWNTWFPELTSHVVAKTRVLNLGTPRPKSSLPPTATKSTASPERPKLWLKAEPTTSARTRSSSGNPVTSKLNLKCDDINYHGNDINS